MSLNNNTTEPQYLYHISLSRKEDLPIVFTPRIPRAVLITENKSSARICLGTSVLGCLTAIGNQQLDSYLMQPVITILCFKVDDLDEDYLLDNIYLADSGAVEDAYLTGEYWYTTDLPLKDAYDVREITLKDVIYSNESEYTLPWMLRMSIKELTNRDYNKYERLSAEITDMILNEGINLNQLYPVEEITFIDSNQVTGDKAYKIHNIQNPILEQPKDDYNIGGSDNE